MDPRWIQARLVSLKEENQATKRLWLASDTKLPMMITRLHNSDTQVLLILLPLQMNLTKKRLPKTSFYSPANLKWATKRPECLKTTLTLSKKEMLWCSWLLLRFQRSKIKAGSKGKRPSTPIWSSKPISRMTGPFLTLLPATETISMLKPKSKLSEVTLMMQRCFTSKSLMVEIRLDLVRRLRWRMVKWYYSLNCIRRRMGWKLSKRRSKSSKSQRKRRTARRLRRQRRLKLRVLNFGCLLVRVLTLHWWPINARSTL